jgi:membrane fusion protein, heavy metal efflux system
VGISKEPTILRVAGRIALADDRTWRVGVLTEGRVEIIYAGLGDYVHKGQVLARMHSHELHEARAQYETSLSELNRLQAAATLAQRNYDRAQTLLGLKAASIQQTEQSRQELVDAQTALRDGQIAVNRDRTHLEDNLGVPADLPDSHDENADLIPITAPGTGYIIEKKVTPGATVEPSTDTFVIGDLSELWMLASVHQEQLGELGVGQPAAVTLPGIPSRTFSGKITNLGQELDPVTRVMQVRILLNNTGNVLRPEMLANAEIPIGAGSAELLVPSDAVQQIDSDNVVFVKVSADRFAVRPVQVAETTAGKTRILAGVSAGDEIVVRGSFVLKSQLLKSTMESD